MSSWSPDPPNLTAVSAGLPDRACLLPCPPGPSIKTPQEDGRDQPENRHLCVTRPLD